MIVVDVNLLLYAVISGFPQHEPARSWWEETLNGSQEVGLTSPAVFGFLRIATNPRVLTTQCR
jgi:predicted nucleic acid-binding protein